MILVVGTVVGLFNIRKTYPLYFIGDFYVIFQFILLGLVFSFKSVTRHKEKILWYFVISQTIIYISSFYFTYTDYLADLNRFASPNLLFIVVFGWFAFYRGKFLSLFILLGLLTMSAMSGFRYAFAVSVLMTLLIGTISLKKNFSRRRQTFLMVLVLCLLIFCFGIPKFLTYTVSKEYPGPSKNENMR